ncbi:MAG: ribosomal-processing cysteine protease Prp [Bacillota bacterium]|nr:ribosomal-processing cysteine protease Prp [Bacillota bacterium]
MIKIVFGQRCGKQVSYHISGHAEYVEGDENVYDDVICGVVSNLGQVAILGVTEVLGLDAPYVAEDGDISLDISRLNCEDIEKCQTLLETVLLGLQNLEISYSEYINVLVEEVQ